MTAIPRRVWVAFAAASTLGSLFIALPDNGERVISISRTHGPAPLDLTGAALMAAGFLALQVSVLRRWRMLVQRVGVARLVAGIVVMIVGVMLLVTAIATDVPFWWAPAGLVVAAPQLAAAVVLRDRHRGVQPAIVTPRRLGRS